MSLGFVVVTYQCRELALECLESLEEHMPGSLCHVAVVDNASTDGTAAAIGAQFPQVKIVQKQRNVGFAAGANAGMRALTNCDVVCLLNPDATALDNGLEAAAEYLRENPDAGVAGARIENADGTLQPSARTFPSHATALFNRHSLATRFLPGNRWSREYLMSDWEHNEIREVDWVAGSCMLVHRRAIERAGLLDAHYFWSIEDVDYCRRVRDAGLKVVYFPGATVRHHVGGSSRHNAYRAMAAHHEGMWRYYRTHMDGNWVLDTITAAGIAARLGLHATSYTLRQWRGKR